MGLWKKRTGVLLDLAPEADSLPVTAWAVVSEGWGRAGETIALVLGELIWVPAVVILALAVTVKDWRIGLLGIAVAAVPLVPVLVCIALATRVYEFTKNGVCCRHPLVLRWRNWAEPWEAYRGVLVKFAGPPLVLGRAEPCRVVLLHRSWNARSVPLYRARSDDGLRAKQDHYAALFGLPAVFEDFDGVHEVADEAVLSHAGLFDAGPASAVADLEAPPPGRRLAYSLAGDTVSLAVRRAALGSETWLIPLLAAACAFLLVLPGVGVGALQPAWLLAAIPAGACAGAGLILWQLREEVRISPEAVVKNWYLLGLRFGRASVPGGTVRTAIVSPRLPWRAVSAVQVLADRGVLHFGYGLTGRQQQWVRDCIIAVIGQGADRSGTHADEEAE
jgi:hypothetical protein